MEHRKLVTASITNLFGHFSHSFSFKEGSTYVILFGVNGVGKTQFLSAIKALLDLDYDALSRIRFDHLDLVFTDGSKLSAIQTVQDNIDDDEMADANVRKLAQIGSTYLTLQLSTTDDDPVVWDAPFVSFNKWTTKFRLTQTSEDVWSSPRFPRPLTTDEVFEWYEDYRYRGRGTPGSNHGRARGLRGGAEEDPVPEPFTKFRNETPAFLIETQRLRAQRSHEEDEDVYLSASHRRREQPEISRIRMNAEDLQKILNQAQTEHSRRAQELDRTFLSRVLESSRSTYENEVRQRYEDQTDFRERVGKLASVAMDKGVALPERTLEDWEINLLDVYLDDADKKLEPFEDLIRKVELLEEIVSSRLTMKSIRVSEKEGLTIVSHFDSDTIDVEQLSAGEQHEIILMYELLFKVPPGAVVMIDEPEISLHIAWQLAFIPDVERIAELVGFQFVVATHSPQIINDSWDETVQLAIGDR